GARQRLIAAGRARGILRAGAGTKQTQPRDRACEPPHPNDGGGSRGEPTSALAVSYRGSSWRRGRPIAAPVAGLVLLPPAAPTRIVATDLGARAAHGLRHSGSRG